MNTFHNKKISSGKKFRLSNEDIIGKIKRAQKTSLSQSKDYQSLISFLAEDPTDVELNEIAEESLIEAEYENLIDPDPFRLTNPIDHFLLMGTIGIGYVVSSGNPYYILPELLNTHMLVLGRTGGGKSNLILLILFQLLGFRSYD